MGGEYQPEHLLQKWCQGFFDADRAENTFACPRATAPDPRRDPIVGLRKGQLAQSSLAITTYHQVACRSSGPQKPTTIAVPVFITVFLGRLREKVF